MSKTSGQISISFFFFGTSEVKKHQQADRLPIHPVVPDCEILISVIDVGQN